jgi:hypothetical protein
MTLCDLCKKEVVCFSSIIQLLVTVTFEAVVCFSSIIQLLGYCYLCTYFTDIFHLMMEAIRSTQTSVLSIVT